LTARDGGNADIAGANICHSATAGFTLPREFVVFVVLCPLGPAAQPYIRFLLLASSMRLALRVRLREFKIAPGDFVISSLFCTPA